MFCFWGFASCPLLTSCLPWYYSDFHVTHEGNWGSKRSRLLPQVHGILTQVYPSPCNLLPAGPRLLISPRKCWPIKENCREHCMVPRTQSRSKAQDHSFEGGYRKDTCLLWPVPAVTSRGQWNWLQAKVKLFSRVRLYATPWILSMGFSRQEYWSGLPFPSPGDLPDPVIKPGCPALEADALTSEPPGKLVRKKMQDPKFSLNFR